MNINPKYHDVIKDIKVAISTAMVVPASYTDLPLKTEETRGIFHLHRATTPKKHPLRTFFRNGSIQDLKYSRD